jgi:hypothetical protein
MKWLTGRARPAAAERFGSVPAGPCFLGVLWRYEAFTFTWLLI